MIHRRTVMGFSAIALLQARVPHCVAATPPLPTPVAQRLDAIVSAVQGGIGRFYDEIARKEDSAMMPLCLEEHTLDILSDSVFIAAVRDILSEADSEEKKAAAILGISGWMNLTFPAAEGASDMHEHFYRYLSLLWMADLRLQPGKGSLEHRDSALAILYDSAGSPKERWEKFVELLKALPDYNGDTKLVLLYGVPAEFNRIAARHVALALTRRGLDGAAATLAIGVMYYLAACGGLLKDTAELSDRDLAKHIVGLDEGVFLP